MRRLYIFIISSMLVGTLFITFVGAAAAKSYDYYVLSTANCFTYVNNNGSLVSFTPASATLAPSTHVILSDLGIKYRHQYNRILEQGWDFQGEQSIVGTSFTVVKDTCMDTLIKDYAYFSLSFACGINLLNNTDESYIDNVRFRCNWNGNDIPMECRYIDVASETFNVRVFTFYLDSNMLPIDSLFQNSYVSALLQAPELEITPVLAQSRASFGLFTSDISLRCMTSTDAIVNGIDDLKDYIEKGNQEMVEAIDRVYDAIANTNIGNVTADKDFGSVNGDMDDLEDAEEAVLGSLDRWDGSIFKEFPSNLTDALYYIGNKLELFLDTEFGAVVFFCLSFGLGMTLIGRAVR